MRIAIFHNIPSGGAKRVVYEHAKELSKTESIDLYRLSYTPESFLDIRPMMKDVFTHPLRRIGKMKPFSYLAWVSKVIDYFWLDRVCRTMAKDIDKRSYDFVYVHQCEISHIPPLVRYLKTPTIVFCQEPWRFFYEPHTAPSFAPSLSPTLSRVNDILQWPSRYLLKILDRRNIRTASQIIANSYYSREYIHKAYGIFSKVNYLGVDTHKFFPQNKERENMVLAVGAIDAKKGYDFIIESLSLINISNRPLFIIVADRTSDNTNEQHLMNLSKEKKSRSRFVQMFQKMI